MGSRITRCVSLCVHAALLVALGGGCSVDSSGTADDLTFGDAAETAPPAFDTGGVPADTTFVVDTAPAGDAEVDTFVPFDSATPPDTTPSDTTPPPPDGPTCDLSACGVPPGAAPKRAALVDSTVACPAGFKSTDVVEAMSGDGCGCGCTLVPGTCLTNANVQTTYSDDAACGTTGSVLKPAGCTPLGTGVGFGGNHFGASVPGATGATCTAAKTTNKAAQTRTLHLCEPNAATCFGAVCSAPFAECIEVAGACPSAYPTSRKVGSDLTLACPAACTCATAPGTCSGTIDFWGTSSCGGTKTSFAVDGTCQPVPAGTGTIRSFTYTPAAPSGGGCTPSFGAAPGTPTLIGARSFCCR